MSTATCSTTDSWTRERILFAMAGTVTLLSVALAVTVSAWFLLLTVVVGVNQLVMVATGHCAASLVVDRLLARRPA